MLRSRSPVAPAFACVLLLAACGGGGDDEAATPRGLRIYHDPYGEVDWDNDLRLKGQHHDHVRADERRIRAYDNAGYHALAPMDYSGVPTLSASLTTRLWPIENVLSPTFLESLTSISIWFPSAEEAGAPGLHVTSSFLPTYIEVFNATLNPVKQPWQYQGSAELFSLIRSGGGLPVWAHPWEPNLDYSQTPGLFGVEIYSAFAEAQRRRGEADYVQIDRNRLLLENWDRALARNQTLVGFAVNDHFGPIPDLPVDDDVRDSGKVIVLAPERTPEAYRTAVQRGAVLAVRDMGLTKDRYPTVRSIFIEPRLIRIDADGEITWISHGRSIGTGAELSYSAFASNTRYVRAEIRNAEGSIVYTQAFSVRPVGDVDGDGDVDRNDEQICTQVNAGTERDPDRVSACVP